MGFTLAHAIKVWGIREGVKQYRLSKKIHRTTGTVFAADQSY